MMMEEELGVVCFKERGRGQQAKNTVSLRSWKRLGNRFYPQIHKEPILLKPWL